MIAHHLMINHRTLYCIAGIHLTYNLNPYPSLLRMFAHEGRPCAVPYSPTVPPLFTEEKLSIQGGPNVLLAASMVAIEDEIWLYTEEDHLDRALLLIDTLDPDSRAHPGEYTLPQNRESELLARYHRMENRAMRGLVVLHPGDSFLIRTTSGFKGSIQLSPAGTWSVRPMTRVDERLFG